MKTSKDKVYQRTAKVWASIAIVALLIVDLVIDGVQWMAGKVTEYFQPYTLLTHDDIQKLIKDGHITADPDNVNATSVDITLHDMFLRETPVGLSEAVVDLKTKEVPKFNVLKLHHVELAPQNFILGATAEMFNLPDNITAEYYLKSSLARSGLDHANAGFIDPGFNNSRLTLELYNNLHFHVLLLTPGMPIGQIKFYRHKKVRADKSYRKTGQYNGDKSVQGSKGLR